MQIVAFHCPANTKQSLCCVWLADGAQECRQLDDSTDLAVADRFAWLTQLEVLEEDNDTHCQNCPKWVANQILDLLPMWLHAQEYKSSEWCFTCPLPQWADVEWTPAI